MLGETRGNGTCVYKEAQTALSSTASNLLASFPFSTIFDVPRETGEPFEGRQ